MLRLVPGLRSGSMSVPVSKSHAHRVLIAEFLAGRTACLAAADGDCDDIAATKRCLEELARFRRREGRERRERRETGLPHVPRDAHAPHVVSLDCGESGTTRRLLGPVVAALGVKPNWIMKGRLASRPQIDYADLRPGVQELAGNVSSQFVSGLLFALPLLGGDSEIRLSSPLASRGYVAMTLGVLRTYGVRAEETATGFCVPGSQRFIAPGERPSFEADWSGAAFPLALKALGNAVEIDAASAAGLRGDSLQPDRVVASLLAKLATDGDAELDVDECPDLFPVLTVVAAKRPGATRFAGIRRLRLKESDRVAAMADVLARFGVNVEVTDAAFVVHGVGASALKGGAFRSLSDHRVAMSIAVGATVADAPVEIDDASCAAKSYPGFFEQFNGLRPTR